MNCLLHICSDQLVAELTKTLKFLTIFTIMTFIMGLQWLGVGVVMRGGWRLVEWVNAGNNLKVCVLMACRLAVKVNGVC